MKLISHVVLNLYIILIMLICFLLSTVACADCNVLGAIRANCWLLAHGQGIFCTVKLMFFGEP